MGGGEKETSGLLVYSFLDDEDACKEFNASDTSDWPNVGNLIVLVDRGSCYFVDKVRHVQNAGGAAAIVIDNKDEPGIPFMADYQNRGLQIAIPSILIHKLDGQKIKNALKDNAASVTVSMRWNLPHPDNRVEWDLWTSSADTPSDTNFKKVFAAGARAFAQDAYFEPHYYFETYRGCLPVNSTSPPGCGNHCTNSGRYCSFTSGSRVDGANVIAEDLRQICIFNVLNASGYTNTYKWWNYVNKFHTMCASQTPPDYSQACAEKCMTGCDIDKAEVQACVTKSHGTSHTGGANTLLDKEIDLRKDLGIYSSSMVTINDQPYRGSINCPSPLAKSTCGVFAMICTGFANSSLISACNSDAGCPLGQKRNECGDCSGQKIKDACGLCLFKNASSFNMTCADCMKSPNGNATKDQCGICNGPGPDSCDKCYDNANDSRRITNGTAACKGVSAGFPTWAVALIVISCVGIVAFGVWYFMKRREEAMREDIDKLLAQYINLDNGQAPLN
jgi:hypothetical protein